MFSNFLPNISVIMVLSLIQTNSDSITQLLAASAGQLLEASAIRLRKSVSVSDDKESHEAIKDHRFVKSSAINKF